MKKILIYSINFYQIYLSFDRGILAIFALGGACKFESSCSEYTKQMVMDFGIIQGSWRGLKRIWSCK